MTNLPPPLPSPSPVQSLNVQQPSFLFHCCWHLLKWCSVQCVVGGRIGDVREIERSDGGDLVMGSATAFATARESQGREMKKAAEAACDIFTRLPTGCQ